MRKIFKCISLFVVATALGCGLTACGDDDDKGIDKEDNNVEDSGSSSGYFESKGQRIVFPYAYYIIDEYETSICFSSVDVMYYYNHPEKVKPGMDMSMAAIEYEIGLQTFPSGSVFVGGDSDVDFYCFKGGDLYDGMFSEEGSEFTDYWDSYSCDTSEITITKNGNMNYTINAPVLNLAYQTFNGDFEPEIAMGKFYYSGKMKLYEDSESRVQVVNDSEFKIWLKKLLKK